MKKVLSFVAILFAVVALNAQNYVVDFEDGTIPANFTQSDADGDGYMWEGSAAPDSYFVSGTDLSGSGHESSNGFALSGSYSNVSYEALTPDNYLITPNLTIGNGSTLTFWCTAQDENYSEEHYAVLVSTTTTDVTAFTTVFEETFTVAKQATWQEKTVDLSSYAGQNIYIAFRHFNCSDQFLLNLDDITVTNASVNTVGINENESEMSIYPNPATSVLNVNGNGFNKVEIVNLLGQVVYSANATSNMQINVSNLNNGAYFVRMMGANGTTTQKFIKK